METVHTHLVRSGALYVQFSADTTTNLNIIIIPGEGVVLIIVVEHCMQKKSVCIFVRYLRGRIKAGTHGLNAVDRAYGRLWSMADNMADRT